MLPHLLVMPELVRVNVVWELYKLVLVLSTYVPACTHTCWRAGEPNLEVGKLSSSLGLQPLSPHRQYPPPHPPLKDEL